MYYADLTEKCCSSMKDKAARDGQTLEEHSIRVAELARDFGEKCGIPHLVYLAGIMHDFGKTQPEFQRYLFDEHAKRGSVLHSKYGAKQIFGELMRFPPAAEILANSVAAHHGRLYDSLSPNGETPLAELLRNTGALEEVSAGGADTAALKAEMDKILHSVPNDPTQQMFAVSMLTKLIFSCLVDADRLDAYLFESGKSYSEQTADWDEMIAQLSKKLAEFDEESDISSMRKKVSEDCAKSGLLSKGIYKLEVPTGGGKTLSGLRFALEHARKHKMDRIIYVIPYLSILSQAAAEIREALNADEATVLEHHSGFMVKPDDEESYKLRTGRWDSPIILTTQVQFLESLFSAKGSDLRKLHNMSNSVIIFDEVQSLPIKCVHLFNYAANFLHYAMGSTLLLCTATQPLFDKVPRPIELTKDDSIAKCGALPERYKLVPSLKPAGYSYPELAEFVLEKNKMSTLVIVNTKAAAKNLLEELRARGANAVHLSTNMCGAHRDSVINKLRQQLKALNSNPENAEPVICVSTALIEAGVNISFECVIRDIAGLDSIYQAAGRCNRHDEFGEPKNVYIVNIAGESLDKLPDIKIGAEVTHRLLSDEDLDIDLYYQLYFYNRKKAMDYPLNGGGSLLDLLSVNQKGKNAYLSQKSRREKQPPTLISSIRSAADEFYVIDKGRTDVIVPYGESEELCARFSESDDLTEKSSLLRELGRYTVSLYQYQVDALQKQGALYEDGGLNHLARGFYHAERGLDLEGNHEFLSV